MPKCDHCSGKCSEKTVVEIQNPGEGTASKRGDKVCRKCFENPPAKNPGEPDGNGK